MAKISLLPALNDPDGTELVPVVKAGKTMRASVAGLVAGAVAGTVDNLKVDAVAYFGRPGDAVLVDGTPTGIGAVYWHDTVDDAGNLFAVDVFDRAGGTINLAVYRGPRNALVRVALTSFKTTGTRTSRRIALAEPIAVRAGDFLAVQPTAGALVVAEVQSGDVGYTYSAPYLPDAIALDAPTTNGQVQVRFVINYRKQVVTADNFLAANAVKIVGPRAVALSGEANPRGYVEWKTTGQPTAHSVRWGNTTVMLDGKAQRMEFPNFSLAQPYAFIGNSLTDSTDTKDRWSQVLAARYGQLMISVARYSSDWRMVYRVGAKAIVLTLAGALPAAGTVAVTKINGAAIDGDNPAAFLTTGDPNVVSGMAMSGYLTRNGVTRRATVSAPNGASFAYVVTQAPGQTAITFDGPVTFVPDFALSVPGRICPIWLGNNYFFSGVANAYGDYTNPQMWVDLKLIVAFLQARGCRVLLIPIIPSANTAEGDNWLARGAGTPYTAMESANARTEALFPGLMAKHADGRTLLKFLQDRNDGSPEALDDVAKGFTPRNLRRRSDGSYDLLHMYGDGAGDRAVADFVDSALQAQSLPNAITQTTDFVITAIGAADQVPDVAVARVGRDAGFASVDGAGIINLWKDSLFRALYDAAPALGNAVSLDGVVRIGTAVPLTWDLAASPIGNPAITCAGTGFDLYHYATDGMVKAGESSVLTVGLIVPAGTTIQLLQYIRRGYAGAVVVTGALVNVVGDGTYKEISLPFMTNVPNGTAFALRTSRTVGDGAHTVCGIALQVGQVARPIAEDRAPRYLASKALAQAAVNAGQIGATAAQAKATAGMFGTQKNLFNKEIATAGYFVNGSGGGLLASASYAASDFIAVVPGQQYTFSDNRPYAFYDSARAFISGSTASLGGVVTVLVPVGAAYIRTSVSTSLVATYQFEAGASSTAYEAYSVGLLPKYLPAVPGPKIEDGGVTNAKLAAGAVSPDRTSFMVAGKNLFNPNDAGVQLGNYIVSGSGISLANLGYNATGYIPVTPGATYTRSYAHQMAFFDAGKAYVSGRPTPAGGPTITETFTVPNGCYFARFTVGVPQWSTFQFEAGAAATAFEAYTGYVIGSAFLPVPDLSKVADRSFPGAKLALGSITPDSTSFMALGKNLANPGDAGVVLGSYVQSGNGAVAANAAYNTTGYIPVTPGATYTRSYSHQMAFFTAMKTFVSGRSIPTGGPAIAETFTVPDNCVYARLSVATTQWGSFQLEAGAAQTPYEAYGFKIGAKYLTGSTGGTPGAAVQDVILPRKIYALIGAPGVGNIEQLNLYFKNIVRGYRGDKLIDCASGFGRQYDECWRVELGNVGTGYANAAAAPFQLQVQVVDYTFASLKIATTTVTPVAKAGGNAVRLLGIGDSITRGGAYLLQPVNKLGGVTLQGIRHYSNDNAALNREGRGGWTLATYFQNYARADGRESPFMFPDGITGPNYRGNTAFWKKAINIAAYPDDNYDLDGFQKIARGWADNGAYLYDANGYPTAPQNGWTVFDPTKAAGSQFQRWDGSAWSAMVSPPATWSLDFAKYLARYPEAFAGGVPTHVSILLSANDFQSLSATATAAALPAFKANLDTLIASIRAAVPAVKIVINVPTIGAPQDAWGMALASGQLGEQYDQNMQASARYLLDAYDTPAMEATGTYVCVFGQLVDPVYGFDAQVEPANIYATATVTRHNNWVHMNDAVGHKQAGDGLAALVQATR